MTIGPRICFDRILPPALAQPAFSLDTGFNPRFEAVFFFRKAWPNGTTLRVRFLEGTSDQQRLAMDQARWWSESANLRLVVSDASDAEIRIAFDPNDGAWSYIGTDCRNIPTDEPTMNLGFQDGGTSGHEFGHAIGLGHEHQNPSGGIQWNEAEVIRDLSRPPNSWTVDQIRHNVIEKYSRDQTLGTNFDPDSIMLYFFPARWTTNGIATHANEVLSATDKTFIASMYPRGGTSAGPKELAVNGPALADEIGAPGEEDLFKFMVTQPGRHIVETTGKTDVMMKLFGPNNQTSLIAEDDDGGVGLNPRIARALVKGEYYVQIRHYNRSGGTGPYKIAVKK
jgi:hypothetical protein